MKLPIKDDEWAFVALIVIFSGLIALLILIYPVMQSRDSFYESIKSEPEVAAVVQDR